MSRCSRDQLTGIVAQCEANGTIYTHVKGEGQEYLCIGEAPPFHYYSCHWCIDCGQAQVPIFTLHDDLWAATGAGKAILCFTCAGRRIGRPLTREDLRPDAPVNRSFSPEPAIEEPLV